MTETRKTDSEAKVLGFFRKYCSEEWVSFLDFYKKRESYRKGEKIFIEGDPVKGMYLIIEGKVKVISTFDNDKVRIIRLARDGHVLGFRGFGGKWIYPVTAIALTDVDVMFIPNNIFNQVLKGNNELLFYFLDSLTEELRRTEALMKRMTFFEVRERIACALLSLIRVFGFDKDDSGLLSYTLSRQDLADYTATTYESVVRTLSEFDKAGIVRIEGKALRIINRSALNVMVAEAGGKNGAKAKGNS